MPTDRFISQTAALRALGGRRVWSLMISLFGDLAREQDQAIDGPILSAIMAGLKVKPEAVRVALHRLRNDGWIVSEKSGRIGRHRLSAKGRAESVAASPRIYADPTRNSEAWQLVLTPGGNAEPSTEMTERGFSFIVPRVYVGPAGAKAPGDALALPGREVPDWLRAEAEPDALRQNYTDLLETLGRLKEDLPPVDDLLPVEVAVLRCLIVHNWRRLVLKHPALPLSLVRPDWPGHLCHLAVHDLLTRYPRPPLEEIEQYRAAA
ncbi:PaaX family transcriptional regulator C-terminal domain-containing protein [Marimonas sp. MJW-29]|uniref:PaaX family transcriptional regulator C-terminal domain-containing protein n=1 Tax=Sulfitobacter sediminis TaxID=3234186 RepID=A0ABV3RNP8_9RHOB